MSKDHDDNSDEIWSEGTRKGMRRITPGDMVSPVALASLEDAEPVGSDIQARIRKVAGPGAMFIVGIRDPVVMIGRAEGVVQVLLEDTSASRYHAAIKHHGGQFFVYDLGSSNGTMVNNEPAGSSVLADGDTIQIGSTVLVFAVD